MITTLHAANAVLFGLCVTACSTLSPGTKSGSSANASLPAAATFTTASILAQLHAGTTEVSDATSSTEVFKNLSATVSNDPWSINGEELSGIRNVLTGQGEQIASLLAAYPTYEDIFRKLGARPTMPPQSEFAAGINALVASYVQGSRTQAGTAFSNAFNGATAEEALANLKALGFMATSGVLAGRKGLALDDPPYVSPLPLGGFPWKERYTQSEWEAGD